MDSVEDRISVAPETSELGRRVARVSEGSRIRIGRDSTNDIPLEADLLVSGEHAEIVHSRGKTEIADLSGSTGLGVYRGGRRVGRAELPPATRFSIGRHDFYFDGEWIYEHDDKGAPSLHVDDLDVDIRRRQRRRLRWRRETILADVSFVLRERTVLGIIGPSGSGKSTLLRAVTGIAPATKGRTFFDNRDLCLDYSALRMAQLVLSGALFEITPGSLLARLSWIDPSRWGFAAVAATTDLNSEIIHDPLWRHEAGGWWLAIGVLAVHTMVLLALARFLLRRYEPGRQTRHRAGW